jgi:hypothetical protein
LIGRIIVPALFAAGLAACQSGGGASSPSSGAQASNEAHNLARSVGNTIGQCWFGAGETAFAGYIYSPEPNAVTPRILIVPKSNPAERPVLVVEATGATTLNTYGPLLGSANAGRIRGDLDRWSKGSTSCS